MLVGRSFGDNADGAVKFDFTFSSHENAAPMTPGFSNCNQRVHTLLNDLGVRAKQIFMRNDKPERAATAAPPE